MVSVLALLLFFFLEVHVLKHLFPYLAWTLFDIKPYYEYLYSQLLLFNWFHLAVD